MKPLKHRIKLIEKIIENYHTPDMAPTRGRPSAGEVPLRLSGRHFPDLVPAIEKKTNPTRQCYICSRKRVASGKRVRRESRYYCVDCDVALCVVPCFRKYHSEKNIE